MKLLTLRRFFAFTVAVAVMVVLVFALVATPAFAHAELESTDPANGAILTSSPSQVSVHFGEDVELPQGSLQVYDAHANRVDKANPHHPGNGASNGGSDGHSVTVDTGRLAPGGYVATWRVTSADSHPVHGAFTFQVGKDAVNTGDLAHRLLTQSQGNTTVGVVYGVVRAIMLGAFAVVVGAVAFVFFVLSDAWDRCWFRHWLWAAVIALFLATLAAFAVQGVYAAALPLERLFNSGLLKSTAATRFGICCEYRLGLLALFTILLRLFGLRRTPRHFVMFGCLAIGLVLTLSLAGHGGTGRWVPLGITADVLHVLCASSWVGGLFLLLRSKKDNEVNHPVVVRGFSRLAFVAVLILVTTGTFQGWRQLNTFHALISTDYGRILLVKVAIVAIMIAAGWRARRALHLTSRVYRSVRMETALSIAVFAVTALLMNAAPAAAVMSKPFSAELPAGNQLVDVIVDPARAGVNVLHLYVLNNQGLPADVPEVAAALTLPAKDLGPIPVPLTAIGQGHFVSTGFVIPFAGRWHLSLTVRTTDTDENYASTDFTIH